ETVEGTSYDAMVAHQQAVAAIVAQDPNVEAFMSSIGSGPGASSANQGRVLIRLKPRPGRRLSADEVIRELQPKLARVPGIRAYTDQYWVILGLLPEFQRDLSALQNLYVAGKGGGLVPLGAVAHIASSVGPLSVSHMGQIPAVAISFNLQPGTSLGEAVGAVQ